MVDATVTAADVQGGSPAVTTSGTAGATITQGEAVYYEQSTGKWKQAEASAASNAAIAAGSQGVGVALVGASDGQPITVLKGGEPYDPGFTATEGEVYVVSATAGGVAPLADLVAGDYVTILGVGDSNGEMVPIMVATGAQVQ